MIRRLFSVGFPAAALFAIATFSGLSVLRDAPAFSVILRSESVLGDWRAVEHEALFEQGDYFFQLGFGYLQSDTARLILGEDTLASPDLFDADMAQARGMIERSLRTSPGRVDSWTSLAWVAVLRNDMVAAEAALRTSWALAPFSSSEAPERVALVAALDLFHRPGWRSDDAAQDAAQNDLDVLDAHDTNNQTGPRERAEDSSQ